MILWSDYSANNHGRSAFKGSYYFHAYERHTSDGSAEGR